MPISFKQTLLLYDSGVYLNKYSGQYIEIDNINDILRINNCQAINADNLIFYSQDTDIVSNLKQIHAKRKLYAPQYGIAQKDKSDYYKEKYFRTFSFLKNKIKTPYSRIKLENRNNKTSQKAQEFTSNEIMKILDGTPDLIRDFKECITSTGEIK